MRQVIKHRDIRLLKMIRRTDPVIPDKFASIIALTLRLVEDGNLHVVRKMGCTRESKGNYRATHKRILTGRIEQYHTVIAIKRAEERDTQ